MSSLSCFFYISSLESWTDKAAVDSELHSFYISQNLVTSSITSASGVEVGGELLPRMKVWEEQCQLHQWVSHEKELILVDWEVRFAEGFVCETVMCGLCKIFREGQ